MAEPKMTEVPARCEAINAQVEAVPRDFWTEEMRESIDSHLVSCERCRISMAATNVMEDELRSLPHLEPPPEMVARILQRTEKIALLSGVEERTVSVLEGARTRTSRRLEWMTAVGVVVSGAAVSVYRSMYGDPQLGILSFQLITELITELWLSDSGILLAIAVVIVIGLYAIGAHFLSAGFEQGDVRG